MARRCEQEVACVNRGLSSYSTACEETFLHTLLWLFSVLTSTSPDGVLLPSPFRIATPHAIVMGIGVGYFWMLAHGKIALSVFCNQHVFVSLVLYPLLYSLFICGLIEHISYIPGEILCDLRCQLS